MLLKRSRKTGGSQVQRVGFRGCFRSRSDFFELRLQSLAICDFEVAAIRVTTILTEMVAILIFWKLDLPLHL